MDKAIFKKLKKSTLSSIIVSNNLSNNKYKDSRIFNKSKSKSKYKNSCRLWNNGKNNKNNNNN